MEQRNNLVLQGTETFSRGQLDNLALENGALVLDSVAGRSLLYGSYTTPEFAMPAFCNLNVSWNAHAPRDTMVEVRCRVYAAGAWTSWMSFGKWAPDYPRCSVSSQSEDGMIFLMGDTVTVAAPGGGTGVQLQVNLSTNNDKVTPAVRLLAAAVRPLAWEKRNGHALNRRLYLPEYCLSAHDPSFGREMDLPLVMAALMNRWGEDILPEEVAYAMEDGSDIVFACWDEHKEAWWRELGSKFTIWSMRVLTDRPKEIYSSNFAVFRRHIRDEVVRYQGPYVYIQGLLFRATANIKNAKAEHYERAQGTSGYSLKSLIRLWSTVLNFSMVPLRVAAVVGAALGVIGLVSALIVFIMRLADPGMQAGWPSLMATMLTCSGLIILFLGIIGEYLGRMFMTINNAPQYVLKETIDNR